MRINSIKLKNFRNHLEKELTFNDGLNVLCGDNGVGKTSILEAISVCSISKSFITNSDVILINKGADKYYVSANCSNDLDLQYKINISFTPKQPKEIYTNTEKRLPKDIIGEIPLVILSPDYKKITSGSPESRRQFINSLLSQASRIYLEKLYEHRRILKQRNFLLSQFKGNLNQNNESLLSILTQWTQALINSSSDLIVRRSEFIYNFNPMFIEAYKTISNSKEIVDIAYYPDTINGGITNNIMNKEQIIEILTQRSVTALNNEIKRSTTLFGAHKDDIKIYINRGIAKEYASQGQHKSLLIAIKFAEFQYLLEKKNETPIILFDDIFSELDNIRIARVLELLSNSKAQIFITLTDPTIIQSVTNMPINLIKIV
jgi:DNA replication and repair protein RecF